MKTIFENCTITYSEYEYFKSLFPDVVIKNVTGAHIG